MGTELCSLGFVDSLVAAEPCQSAVGALVEPLAFVNAVVEMTNVGGNQFRSRSDIDRVGIGWIYCDRRKEGVRQPFTAGLPGQARVVTAEDTLVRRDVCDI